MAQVNRIFTIALIVCVVLAAVLTTMYRADPFAPKASVALTEDFGPHATPMDTAITDNEHLLNKTLAYYRYLYLFFTTDNAANTTFKPIADVAIPLPPATGCATSGIVEPACQYLQVMKFLPSYLDGYCKLSGEATLCNRFHIDNVTCVDSYPYTSSMQCMSVNASIGIDKTQSLVRVFNNNYSFNKNCMSIKLSGVVAAGAGSTISMPLHGNIDWLVLLRPLMVSFGRQGLYKVVCNGADNPFASYSSVDLETNKAHYRLMLERVVHNNAFKDIYSDDISTGTLVDTVPDTNMQVYYLNYERQAGSFSASTFNVMSLIFDNEMLTVKPSIAFTLTSNSPSLPIATLITFNYDNVAKTFTATIDASASGQAVVCSVHPDFTTQLNDYAWNSGKVTFHIIVTYSLDVMTITGLIRTTQSPNSTNPRKNNSMFFVTRTDVKSASGGTPIYLQYVRENFASTHGKYDNICPISSIPNLAQISKQLGYAFA